MAKNYKERLRKEYLDLKARYNKLHNFLVRYDAGKIEENISDIELLRKQVSLMGNYLYVLEVRAIKENISLSRQDVTVTIIGIDENHLA